jgi:putative FmdB family regulatory protein
VPVYEYRCGACGPFEERRDHAVAGEPLACPACGASAARAYGAPFVRSPASPFASASRDVRARVERSHTGEPVLSHGGPPPGRAVDQVMHAARHGHHRHAPRQPWLIGH